LLLVKYTREYSERAYLRHHQVHTVFSGLVCKSRFFLATAAGRLILRCDLYADKFIAMPLSETIGLLIVSVSQ